MFDKNLLVPKDELKNRMSRFRESMNELHPTWRLAMIAGQINQYYFTGTMQDALMVIPRDDEAILFVKKSYERALEESNFENIIKMQSFREAKERVGILPSEIFMDTSETNLERYFFILKYFPFEKTTPIDDVLNKLKGVKSEYELSLIRRAGEIHSHVLDTLFPLMLKEGISEASLALELYKTFVEEGHMGVTRFPASNSPVVLGHLGFGETPILSSSFDGASGTVGLCPAAPVLGQRDRKLMPGDLVYIDCGCAYLGYHSDVTRVFSFKKEPPKFVMDAHNKCREIQSYASSLLIPGAIPEEIYQKTLDFAGDDFKENFMGYGSRIGKFIGHSIGLHASEQPILAKGFLSPIEAKMVFAIEPKKGIVGHGMVGSEDIYEVTASGARCLTGGPCKLIVVG